MTTLLKNITGIFFLLPAFALMALSAPVPWQEQGGYEPHSGQSIFDLLHREELIEITLRGNLDSMIHARRTNRYMPARLSYTTESGAIFKYDVRVKPRGKFRRRVCDFPPLKIKFSKDQLEAAGLSEHNDLKLVTHCLDDESFSGSLVLKEYLAYKLYNQLTPFSFRVQLVKITYQDEHNKRYRIKKYGFLLEDVDELAERLGGKDCDDCLVVPADKIRTSHERIMSLFQYMIGNLDYSLNPGRNVKWIEMDDGTFVPIPYDFDFTMLVRPPYLRANTGAGQTSSMQRVFLGNATRPEQLRSTIAYFKTKKKALLDTIRDFDFFKREERFQTELYIDSFFEILQMPQAAKYILHPDKEPGIE